MLVCGFIFIPVSKFALHNFYVCVLIKRLKMDKKYLKNVFELLKKCRIGLRMLERMDEEINLQIFFPSSPWLHIFLSHRKSNSNQRIFAYKIFIIKKQCRIYHKMLYARLRLAAHCSIRHSIFSHFLKRDLKIR